MVDLRGKTPCDGVDCPLKRSCFRRFLLKPTIHWTRSNQIPYYSGASLTEEARTYTKVCKKYIPFSKGAKKKIASSVTDKYEFTFKEDYEETIGRNIRIKI